MCVHAYIQEVKPSLEVRSLRESKLKWVDSNYSQGMKATNRKEEQYSLSLSKGKKKTEKDKARGPIWNPTKTNSSSVEHRKVQTEIRHCSLVFRVHI